MGEDGVFCSKRHGFSVSPRATRLAERRGDGTVILFPTSHDAASGIPAARAVDVLSLDEEALRALRGERIAYVPQDPALSLNPSIRIGEQILGMLKVLEVQSYAGDRKAACARSCERSICRTPRITCGAGYTSFPVTSSSASASRWRSPRARTCSS